LNLFKKTSFLWFCALILPVFSPFSHSAGADPLFRRIAPGVEATEWNYFAKSSGNIIEFVFVRVDPKIATLSVGLEVKAKDVRQASMKRNAIAGINANYFDPEGNPLGLVISNGHLLHSLQRGGNVITGVFAIIDNLPIIIHRDAFSRFKNVQEAIEAGPRLIADRRPLKVESYEASRRSAVAVTSDHRIIFAATKNRLPGATLKELQDILLEPLFQITEALNLDGGGSSQLYVSGFPAGRSTWVSGGDPVPVGIYVTRALKVLK